MNVDLLDPFADKYPNEISTTLDEEANVARFNPTGFFAGAFLAVGRSDGFVAVWDVETKQVIWAARAHYLAIETVCWSRNSRFLLTASKDCTCVIWDLETGQRKETVRFEAPVLEATFHPHNCQIILVTLSTSQTWVVNLRPSCHPEQRQQELFELEPEDPPAPADEPASPQHTEGGKGKAPEEFRKPANYTTARFTPDGSKIFVGTKAGQLLVFDSGERTVILDLKIGGTSAIRMIEFDRSGQLLVINSADRALRVMTVLPPNPKLPREVEVTHLHKFQDLINRTPWSGIGFSGDGDFVIGGAGHKASHDIHIWDRADGTLQKILEWPKEPLEDVAWHPTKPMIASVSVVGTIHLWSIATADTWSAFAPGFEELEENHTYEEHEDEFDVEDAESLAARKRLQEDNPIDIFDSGPVSSKLPYPPPMVDKDAMQTDEDDADDVEVDSDWWEDEPDDDDKDDWFMPIRLVPIPVRTKKEGLYDGEDEEGMEEEEDDDGRAKEYKWIVEPIPRGLY